MASQAYWDWRAAGKPYKLARPCLELQAILEDAGYIVYDYPDYSHQTAEPPEDHTPYSATGSPITSARWVGHALDIMPEAGLMPLATLARRIIAARDRRTPGTLWIKYLNWTDEAGVCRHERWADDGTRETSSSTDKGHIHISARSDYDTSDTVSASGWNPLEGTMDSDQLTTTNWRLYGTGQLWEYVDNHVNNKREPIPLVTLLKRVDMTAQQILTLLTAVMDLVNAGGGSIDTAAVLARVDELAALESARDAEQSQRIADLEAELAAERAATAAAHRAAADLIGGTGD